jgi:hypothetical protein
MKPIANHIFELAQLVEPRQSSVRILALCAAHVHKYWIQLKEYHGT